MDAPFGGIHRDRQSHVAEHVHNGTAARNHPIHSEQQREQFWRQRQGTDHDRQRYKSRLRNSGDAHRSHYARKGSSQHLAVAHRNSRDFRDEEHRHRLVKNDPVIVKIRRDAGTQRGRARGDSQILKRFQCQWQSREARVHAERIEQWRPRGSPEHAWRFPGNEKNPGPIDEGDLQRKAQKDDTDVLEQHAENSEAVLRDRARDNCEHRDRDEVDEPL